jgi:hypothetical protein
MVTGVVGVEEFYVTVDLVRDGFEGGEPVAAGYHRGVRK